MNCFLKVATLSLVAAQMNGLLFAADPAPTAPAKVEGPKAAFSELIYDFGKVLATEPLRHDFMATNIGNALLEITDVKPGCGCTTAGEWDKKVEPGKAGKIPIAFNPGSYSGTVIKYVTVTSNDKEQPTTMLQIKATIWRPIEVQPNFVFFMPVEGEETNEIKTVKVLNQTDEPMTVEAPQSSNPAFRTELKTVQPGKEFDLNVQYLGPGTNVISPGTQGVISMKTSSTNTPVINVTISAMPQPSISANPGSIALPAGPLASNLKHMFTIRNNSSHPYKFSEPAVNAEGVTTHVSEAQDGKSYIVEVEFPAKFVVPSGKQMNWTIKTTNPKVPVFTVPISQEPAPAPAPK